MKDNGRKQPKSQHNENNRKSAFTGRMGSVPGRQRKFKNDTKHRYEHRKEHQLSSRKGSKPLRGTKARHKFGNLEEAGFYRRLVVKWKESKDLKARHNLGNQEEVGFYRRAVIKWDPLSRREELKQLTLDVRRVAAFKGKVDTKTMTMAKAKKQMRMDAFRQIDKGEVSEVASPPRVENTAKNKRNLKAKKRGKNGSPIKKQHRKMTDKEEEALLDELIRRNQERKAAEAAMEESDSDSDVQFMQVKKGKKRFIPEDEESELEDDYQEEEEEEEEKKKKDNFRNQVRILSLLIKVKKSQNKTQAKKEVWMQCRELFKKIQEHTPDFTVYRFHQRKKMSPMRLS